MKGERAAATAAQRHHRAIGAHRAGDTGGERWLSAHLRCRLVAQHRARERRPHGRLRRENLRDRIGYAQTFELAEALGYAEQKLAIASRQNNRAGGATAQLVEDLVRDGLVALGPEWIAGVKAR